MGEMILTDTDLMDAAHWPVTVTSGLYGDRDPNCASVEGAGAREGSCEVRSALPLARSQRVLADLH